jgi:hypothetical protein
MRVIKLFIILVIFMPTLFVMGTIAQTTETLGPLSVGGYSVRFDNIAEIGGIVKDATEDFTRREIAFLHELFQDLSMQYEGMDFAKRLTEQSV